MLKHCERVMFYHFEQKMYIFLYRYIFKKNVIFCWTVYRIHTCSISVSAIAENAVYSYKNINKSRLPGWVLVFVCLTKVRSCVLTVLAPASFLENGAKVCCSLQETLTSRPDSFTSSCSQLWIDFTIGKDWIFCNGQIYVANIRWHHNVCI